jgi:hypothetical protein
VHLALVYDEVEAPEDVVERGRSLFDGGTRMQAFDPEQLGHGADSTGPAG